MDGLRLDGNAAAGTLGEVFTFEVTTAHYACEGCGRVDQIGAAMVYEVRGLGTIVRCPGCDTALIRLAHVRGHNLVDLRETSYLATGRFIRGMDNLTREASDPAVEGHRGRCCRRVRTLLPRVV
jgi:hypothetical protein